MAGPAVKDPISEYDSIVRSYHDIGGPIPARNIEVNIHRNFVAKRSFQPEVELGFAFQHLSRLALQRTVAQVSVCKVGPPMLSGAAVAKGLPAAGANEAIGCRQSAKFVAALPPFGVDARYARPTVLSNCSEHISAVTLGKSDGSLFLHGGNLAGVSKVWTRFRDVSTKTGFAFWQSSQIGRCNQQAECIRRLQGKAQPRKPSLHLLTNRPLPLWLVLWQSTELLYPHPRHDLSEMDSKGAEDASLTYAHIGHEARRVESSTIIILYRTVKLFNRSNP
jgi:hypothetical protein